jgi:N-methylhydantoinase B
MLKTPILQLRNDPITFEVLRHRLWQINDEQGQTIIRVSGSPVATEGNDFNVAIADASGALIAVGPYIVMHVAAITDVIHNTIDLIGEEGIQSGDMYLVNDSWMGAGHQNDFCIIQPVFWEGKRIAWTASVIHQVDVGGPAPGSWNFAARTVFEEAPRYKALRLVRYGVVQPEVVATVLTNSRLPDQVDLDMRAQIAAGNVARERIFELIGRYGIQVVSNAIADQLDYAQVLFKQKLLSISDGSWYAEDYLDHDGHEERNYRICCRLTKRGDRLYFDFTGTSKQAPGLINSTYAGAAAGVYSAVYPYLCAKIPWNAGVLRQIDLTVEEGTVHNATFPAPVGYGVVHASWSTMNAAAFALGKMLASSADPGEAMAGWAGSTFVYNIFGRNDAGEPFATMLLSSDLQGTGARSFGDGYDVGGKLNAPRAKVTNIESAESRYPLLYLYRRHTRDSGGAGKWRGGVSAEVALTAHGAPQIDFTVNTVGASHSSTQGINGGYPGGGATVMLATQTEMAAHWAKGRLPQDVTEIGGDFKVMPSKLRFVMRPGDVFVAVPHGGGGFGDPLLRDPHLVARDVAEGNVSADWAKRIYGVVLRPDGSVSEAKTPPCRDAIRRARLGSSLRIVPCKQPATKVEALVSDGKKFYCTQCGTDVGSVEQDARTGLIVRISELGEGGAWLARRWQGRSPDVKLWQYFCPGCGSSISVEQHLTIETKPWTDSLARTLSSPDVRMHSHD